MNESKGLLYNKWFYWTLFIFLFAYATVRAWTVVPILDELATFYMYIRTGHYFNTIEIIDANNHVLNSFFGHQFYRLFGDHFFLFRLPSLFAFPIYFFSVKYIVQKTISSKLNVLVFLALVCIPWLFEYFSYARGYGMAIAFFFAAIASLIHWETSRKLLHFASILVCLWISVASSLTYLFPSLLIVCYAILLFILNKNFQKRILLVTTTLILLWIFALLPFIRYSFELKEIGALWWGNQDGLWETTGKSMSRLVIFDDANWVFYLIASLLIFVAFSFLLSWRKVGFWNYLKQSEAMLFLVFFGSVVGIVAMRYLLDVNYPMDRVGMYLVPLFMLVIGVYLSKCQWTKFGLIALCFLPISFLFKLNFSTSIFSPEDRIPTYLTNEIKSNLTDQIALSAEYVSHMSYAYSCRNDEKVHIAYTGEQDEEFLGEYHINWLGRYSRKGYSITAQDPESRTRVLKQTHFTTKKLIADTLIRSVNLTDIYLTIFDRQIDSSWQSSPVQVQISAKMTMNQASARFNIIQTLEDANANQTRASNPNFGWYFGDRKNVSFVYTDRMFELKPEETRFNFFLFNPDLKKIKIELIRVRIYQIDLKKSN